MNKDKKEKRKNLDWYTLQEIDTKLEIATHHLELSRIVLHQLFDEEVTEFAGERYSRSKPHDGRYHRWGTNPGSVSLGAQKIPVEVPRVYDKQDRKNQTLDSYSQVKNLREPSEEVMNAVLFGVGTRNYRRSVEVLSDSFGLSKTSVSEAFIERSAEALREFNERDFSQHTFVAVFVDGKHLQAQQMVIVLGVDEQGAKIPLGFVQATTENAESITELFRNLIQRGLQIRDGLLFIVDGGKGLRKAIETVFGDYAVVQRCFWHKRENIVKYLPESQQEKWRKRLTTIFALSDYTEAKKKFEEIRQDLRLLNVSAVSSLDEGLEDCLTLHRLGIAEDFSKSFSTTNCIESLNSQITRFTRNVRCWQNSEQRHRWIAVALLEIELRMNKVKNHNNLSVMQHAIKKAVQDRIDSIPRRSKTSPISTKKRT